MPILNLKLSGPEDVSLSKKLAEELTKSVVEILHKKYELISIIISFHDEAHWWINNESLSDLNAKSFHLEIKITDSTNLKNEKSALIHKVHKIMSTHLVNIHPISYTAITEMSADSFGYDGSTTEYKYIQSIFSS
ncbi:tautomerase family protein [Pedobacter sp. BMA]|uniref:tautomerase family protein n=1 Tax=Pedobacter sp. BMA TaxID=1663685 RepID=UPI000649983F|nr:tautomerase family protein [Pedobacter sp. BMA]KLT67078.1 4-oxalocrotonate tautomerase [Pedobacter sp. BMA]